jgi:peroxiredoxin
MTFSITDLGYTLDQVQPGNGWHCSHFFYSFNRPALASLSQNQFNLGRDAFQRILDPAATDAPARLQTGCVAGHLADFSLMLMDPDPIKIERVHQSLLGSPLGTAIHPVYSYVSISEVSEYAQTVEQYAERLKREGEDANSSAFETKLNVYAQRLEKMNYQRLTPDFPTWPVSCFYPMNKWRYPGANWFMLSSSERHRLMSEHARSGIKFAGKVSQLITVGIGLDDWEWGVTLWATNPMHLKQIVYDMRFDEASAKYAEFGGFYTSYLAPAEKILQLCCIAS